MRTLIATMLALTIGLVLPARGDTAAPLADRVPGDAILYLGWAGTDALSAKYDGSHLKKVVDASDMSEVFNTFIPRLIGRVAKDDQNIAEVLQQVVAIGKPLWKHPTAFYFGGVDFTAAPPVPHLAMLCDAGDDAAGLTDRISKLLEQAPRENGPLPSVKQYGTLVVLAFGTVANIDADFAQAPPVAITKAPNFVSDMEQVQQDPAYVEYIDVDRLVKAVDEGIQKMGEAHITDRWTHARAALGVDGIHSGIVTGGFDGADWTTQAFVATGEGNTGLQQLFHSTPLSKEIMATIPQTADRMAAGKFDLDAFVGNVHDIVAQIDQSTADQIDQGLAQVNEAAGLDIRKDLLANLGDEWAAYSDKKIAGPGIFGLVVVNHLKNADAFDNSINQLAHQANRVIADQMHEPDIKIEFHDTVVNGVTLHYLAVPLVTPTWAVKDGNLYMGLYPQVVSGAVEQVSTNAPSILQRQEYIDLMKRLGDHAPCSVEFSNLPATAPDVYGGLLMMSRLYLGYADIYGVHPPAIIVPPLNKIMPELSPAGGVVWTDATGLHEKDVCPFPGSEIMSQGNKNPDLLAAVGKLVDQAVSK